ncbi:hypothetical protein GCM10012286_25870 [Streptomyces lasiicapitis]|uniref:Uncharacterized protein n=1 Tax=Streptomyces lasiicapitis TaxID=1923961 RepID=A0ABQ2LTT7_9ACTN|nr:hypothetical protein GCM10012286_25870 [Streptomyces lasiicapitis]
MSKAWATSASAAEASEETCRGAASGTATTASGKDSAGVRRGSGAAGATSGEAAGDGTATASGKDDAASGEATPPSGKDAAPGKASAAGTFSPRDRRKTARRRPQMPMCATLHVTCPPERSLGQEGHVRLAAAARAGRAGRN